MKKFTTSDRLKQIMQEKGMRQVDILNACKPHCKALGVKLNKNDLSQYVSGKTVPRQDKATVLALALNVSEVWLLGYDVPIERDNSMYTPTQKKPQVKYDSGLTENSVLICRNGETQTMHFTKEQIDMIEKMLSSIEGEDP